MISNSTFKSDVSFNSLRVNSDIDLLKTIFQGKVDLTGARFLGRAVIVECTFNQPLMLAYVAAERDLRIETSTLGLVSLENGEVRGELNFRQNRFDGPLILNGLQCGTLATSASLSRDATAKDFVLCNTEIQARGLRYRQFRGSWRDLLAGIAKVGEPNLDPFYALEHFLRSIGRDDWADEAYYEGRLLLSRSIKPRSLRKGVDNISRLLTGYGVRSERAVVSVLLLFMITLLVVFLVPSFAIPINGVACGTTVHPDLEVAANLTIRIFSSLDDASVGGWHVSDCNLIDSWLHPYSIVALLRLVGILIIPFTVASVTGLIKYLGRQIDK
jgi:hypothetical protein